MFDIQKLRKNTETVLNRPQWKHIKAISIKEMNEDSPDKWSDDFISGIITGLLEVIRIIDNFNGVENE